MSSTRVPYLFMVLYGSTATVASPQLADHGSQCAHAVDSEGTLHCDEVRLLQLRDKMTQPKASVWTQFGGDIDGEAPGDSSGASVALSADGTRLAVGAPESDGFSGRVRVYQEAADAWTQLGGDIEYEVSDDFSGASVALSADGTRLAVGAPRNDGAGPDSGHVRVYQEAAGAWTRLGADVDGEAPGDLSGVAVALSADGTRLAVGAPGSDGAGSDSGRVRVYQEAAGAWTQLGGDIDGDAPGDRFGNSVALSAGGTRLAVGAPRNDGAGSVRVYQEVAGWTQLGGDIECEALGDRFGNSAALSADGTRLAVGAPRNDGAGSDSGHVRVYQEAAGAWTQLGGDIDGEASGDLSGASVALSIDGTRLAVGAPGSDGAGCDSGRVRVFKATSTTSTPASREGA